MTQKTDKKRSVRRTPLALSLKLVGYLTGPTSTTGRAFIWCEKGMTRGLTKLANSPLYLRLAGGMMRSGFHRRTATNRLMEEMLHAMRCPSLSDVESLEQRLARVLDKLEALETQLEYATTTPTALKGAVQGRAS